MLPATRVKRGVGAHAISRGSLGAGSGGSWGGIRETRGQPGHWLVAMRERAELLGGTLEFVPPAAGGAFVRLSVPKERVEAHAESNFGAAGGRSCAGAARLPADAGGRVGRIAVVGEASDGDEGGSPGRELQPDVVVMDFALPGMNGPWPRGNPRETPETDPDAQHALRRHVCAACLEAGARGYLLKNAMDLELVQARPERVAAGELCSTRACRTRRPQGERAIAA